MEKQVFGASSLRRSKAGPRTREKTMREHAGFRRGAQAPGRAGRWCPGAMKAIRHPEKQAGGGGVKAYSPRWPGLSFLLGEDRIE